jgi:hypothetical protein
MSNRISKVILLCEDDPQERLVRCYLEKCGFNTTPPYLLPINASRQVHGGNVLWVLREFPKQLLACRQRHSASANTLLIVVVDADNFAVEDRRKQFAATPPRVKPDDPLVILIPRRHIETWIRSALGNTVNETDDYKTPKPNKSEIRDAAQRIYGWSHDQQKRGSACVQSLLSALPEWRRIG